MILLSCDPFLESPETFRTHFGWHDSLCVFKTKASPGTKLCSYFNFYYLYNRSKDQLNRISEPQLYEWLLGPEKFSGLSRNGFQESNWFEWFRGKKNLKIFCRVLKSSTHLRDRWFQAVDGERTAAKFKRWETFEKSLQTFVFSVLNMHIYDVLQ